MTTYFNEGVKEKAKAPNRGIPQLFSIPFVLVLLDIVARWQYLIILESKGRINYLISIVFEFTLYIALMRLFAFFPRVRRLSAAFFAVLIALTVCLVFGHFRYFGVLPNDYSLNYLVEHFDDSRTLLLDSVNIIYLISFVSLSLLFYFLSYTAIGAAGRIGKKSGIALFIVLTLFLFFLNNNVRFNPASYSFSSSTIFSVKYFLQKKYFGQHFLLESGYVQRKFSIKPRVKQPLPYNILLIISESVQRNNLQYYGYARKTAPYLDELVKKGAVVAFNRHYSNAVSTQFCLPMLFSGIFAIDKVNQPYIYDYIKTWTGARTAYFSSQSMQKDNIDLVFNTSLDTFVCQENSNIDEFNDRGVNDFQMLPTLLNYLTSHNGNTFFCVFQLNNTHYPYKVSRAANTVFHPAEPTSLNAYDNTLIEQDQFLQELLRSMEKSGLLKNTVIIFTSDHCEAFGEHNHNGHLQTLYNEDTAVPLWIRLPDDAPDWMRDSLSCNSGGVSSHLDLFPTMLDFAGILDLSRLAFKPLGVSLLRNGIHPAVPLVGKDMIDTKAIVTDSIKFILTNRDGKIMYELFQLNTDWKEERNIWNELPERDRATLRARLLDSERERLKFDPE